MEWLKPRPHAPIKEIVDKAKNGDAFFVNRAAYNGDLAIFPDAIQQLIVAVANDEAAAYALNQVIPQSDAALTQNNEFIGTHIDRATRTFAKKGQMSLKDQIEDFYT